MSEIPTLIEQFYNRADQSPNKIFLRQPFGRKWKTYTWKEVDTAARTMAAAINSYDLPLGSHIGIVSKNCVEWIIADLAIMMSRHVSVPLYATLTSDQIKEVIEIGDIALLFVGKLDVWDGMKDGVSPDLPVITFPQYEGCSVVDRGMAWTELMNSHSPVKGNPSPKMDDIWTIVFTSGTTGTPKGVMLSYQKLAVLLELGREENNLAVSHNGDNRFFSYLPLNHIAERMIVENTAITYGGSISFAENLETFTQNLVDTDPTVFFAVPRIWTKFQLGILQKMPQQKLDKLLSIPLVSSLIKRKIKRGLGLASSRVNVSGAAPITEECVQWYKKLGIEISVGYGMTENCAVTSFLRPHENKYGSVGRPVNGVELKIDPETKEVLMKSDFVMNGYYKNPEQSEKTIKDQWLHTGDQGYIDDEGYLYLTGRIKDTFKTAKGQFVVPAPIEFKFRSNDDIEQICLLGLGLPQPIALVSLSEIGKVKSKQSIQKSLNDTLVSANADLDNYKKVNSIVLIKEPFSVENGLLTPTLKTKRNKVHDKYGAFTEGWYNEEGTVIYEK